MADRRIVRLEDEVPRPYATEPPEPPDAQELVEMLRTELAFVRAAYDTLAQICRDCLPVLVAAAHLSDPPRAQAIRLVERMDRAFGCREPDQPSQAKPTP